MTTQTDEREPRGHYEMRLGERWVPIKHVVLRALASQWGNPRRYETYTELIRRFIEAHPDNYRYVKD